MTKQTRAEQNTDKKRYWQAQMQSWKESGMSQTGYCLSRNLSLKTFCYWRRKLKGKASGITLIQIPEGSIEGKENRSAGLRLLVDGKFEIEVAEGFSPSTLTELVKAVESL
jgi:hypothetical protein